MCGHQSIALGKGLSAVAGRSGCHRVPAAAADQAVVTPGASEGWAHQGNGRETGGDRQALVEVAPGRSAQPPERGGHQARA